MNQSSSHDLSTASFEIFDDSFDEPCSSPCALVSHSTPIKNSLYAAIPEGPDILISSDSDPEIEIFDESTTSGKCESLALFDIFDVNPVYAHWV